MSTENRRNNIFSWKWSKSIPTPKSSCQVFIYTTSSLTSYTNHLALTFLQPSLTHSLITHSKWPLQNGRFWQSVHYAFTTQYLLFWCNLEINTIKNISFIASQSLVTVPTVKSLPFGTRPFHPSHFSTCNIQRELNTNKHFFHITKYAICNGKNRNFPTLLFYHRIAFTPKDFSS